MSDAATPLIEPDETAVMIRRELEVLGELAELGLRMARTITDQACGEAAGPEPAFQSDLPLAFSRVSRAVRMAVLLQAKLIQDLKGGGKASPEDEDEGPVEWAVRWVDEDTGEPVRERDERRESERRERLERDDIHAAVMGRPTDEVIAEIRQDLGLEGEAPHLPREAAGGGPLAERSEERVVEGASQAHHPTASSITDSS